MLRILTDCQRRESIVRREKIAELKEANSSLQLTVWEFSSAGAFYASFWAGCLNFGSFVQDAVSSFLQDAFWLLCAGCCKLLLAQCHDPVFYCCSFWG